MSSSAPTRCSASGSGTGCGRSIAPRSSPPTSWGSSTPRCGTSPGAWEASRSGSCWAASAARSRPRPPRPPSPSTDEYLDVATQCLELGYRSIKLHAWGDARADAQLCLALREHVGPGVELAYDGSAGFDLADAIYLGHALDDAGYLWYEEPIREFSVTAYKWLAERVRVPLLVAETSDGAHMNTADFIASGAATFVRTSAELRGGITGAMRIAHLADSFRLRAEVHGPGLYSQHLCMAIPNTTFYESLVTSTRVVREAVVDRQGLVHAPTQPGFGLPSGPDYPQALAHLVI